MLKHENELRRVNFNNKRDLIELLSLLTPKKSMLSSKINEETADNAETGIVNSKKEAPHQLLKLIKMRDEEITQDNVDSVSIFYFKNHHPLPFFP